MITLRKAQDRGHANHGWLDSWHTFSFADYHDPAHMGFGPLRVINEDRVEAGMGFDRHGHRDMEIVSYVLDGQLEHRDSMGIGEVIEPGDVQRMSAGRGVLHSEYNPSFTDPVHFLQIWIEPDRTGHAPSYEQKHFPEHDKRHRLRLVVSPDGADGSLTIHQDARIYAGLLDSGDRVTHPLAPGRRAWVHVARGGVRVNGLALGAGDAAALTAEPGITLDAAAAAEILVFDLP
jgi:redox-sensitive bicupin YhaK (pirin superfamily)